MNYEASRSILRRCAPRPVAALGEPARREELLRAGVRRYELKPTVEKSERGVPGGSSDASLHAKTFAVDRSRIFVGSFNFDPRSARLNTEMGVVVKRRRSRCSFRTPRPGPFAQRIRGSSFQGNLEWVDGERRYTSEPGTGFLRRAWIGFLSILPIERLL